MSEQDWVLGFDRPPPRARNGYPVVGPDGEQVATVNPGYWLARFTAVDADGRALCHGKSRLISGWRGYDADGEQRVLYRIRPARRQHIVQVADATLHLTGRPFGRDWRATDERTGQVLLHGIRGASGLGELWGPDIFVVRAVGRLRLSDVVTIVELSRQQQRISSRRTQRRAMRADRKIEAHGPFGL